MIFSTTTCPICQSLLKREEAYEDAQHISIQIFYVCEKIKLSFVDYWGTARTTPHYIYRANEKPTVSMLFPPYGLEHTETSSLLFLISETNDPKYIAELSLMDMDYTDAEAVLQKLHTLITFS